VPAAIISAAWSKDDWVNRRKPPALRPGDRGMVFGLAAGQAERRSRFAAFAFEMGD
jgi:hypothetical protein